MISVPVIPVIEKFLIQYFLPATRKGKVPAQKDSGAVIEDGVGNAQAGDGVDQGQFDFIFYDYVGDGAAASHSIVWQIYYTKKYL